jgi:polysaccharide pyruvyl transferase WcaK-like protein
MSRDSRRLARRVRTRAGALKRSAAAWRRRPSSDPARVDAYTAPIAPPAPTDPPGPTILLLNDCRDQENFGASVLVDGLLKILSRRLPSTTIVPIPSHWLIDGRHGLSGFWGEGAGMTQPKASFPEVADQFETVADEWLSAGGGPGAPEFLVRLRSADLVVLNGEGSLYRDNLSAIRELFLAWLSKERLGIPTIFVNGMVHLTDVTPILPAMVRKTFSVLDAITVRESCSLRNLEQYAPGISALLVPDSAFATLPAAARHTPAVHKVLEMVGDSPFFCFDPGAMPIDHRPARQSALFQLVTRLKGAVGQAVLVSSAPADRYIKAIADETGSVYVDTIADYREFMALVDHARFLVSGRYHNPILAAIVGCPSVTLASTSHKVHGTCEMLGGLIGTPFDGTDIRSCLDAIDATAMNYLDQGPALRLELQAVCRRRGVEADELGDIVAAALELAPQRADR